MSKPEQPVGAMNRFLNAVEAAGNKLPHITMLFIYALVIAIILSFLLSFISFDYKHPSTGETIRVLNMLSPKNLLDLVVSSVRNFMNFPPLGMTIVATMGIGIAEGSGFIHVLLKKLLLGVGEENVFADVNCDGNIDIKDLISLKKLLAK